MSYQDFYDTRADEHLCEYAYVNQSHHENIDDQNHSHTHKHSENGEEHEHHHGHKKPLPQEVQFYSSVDCLDLAPIESFSKNVFREVRFYSDPSFNEVFRPPIV